MGDYFLAMAVSVILDALNVAEASKPMRDKIEKAMLKIWRVIGIVYKVRNPVLDAATEARDAGEISQAQFDSIIERAAKK